MSYDRKRWCRTVGVFVLVAVALATTTPAEAQRDYEPLYSVARPESYGEVSNLRLQITPVIKSPFIK